MNRNKIIDKVIQNSIDGFLSQRGEKNNISPRIEGEVLMYRKLSETELKLQDIKTIETIKTLGNYSEKEKVKYEFDKTRNFYNSILDMVHKFRIKNNL